MENYEWALQYGFIGVLAAILIWYLIKVHLPNQTNLLKEAQSQEREAFKNTLEFLKNTLTANQEYTRAQLESQRQAHVESCLEIGKQIEKLISRVEKLTEATIELKKRSEECKFREMALKEKD